MPGAAHAQTVSAFAAIFDARLTPVRSDDSLIAQTPTGTFQFNVVSYMNAGAPIADLPFEAGALYRLVFQINCFANWDYDPKETGKGLFALAGTTGRFGRAVAPIPGTAELLLTNTLVANEYTDPIDFVIGMTDKFTPRVPWSMVSDPFADHNLDEGKTAEIGSLRNAVPSGTFIDCIDHDKNWEELTGSCEKERYYFYEIWFQSDLDWKSGDTADVFLYLEGKPEPTNIELHMRFRLVDDDSLPPVISEFSPEIMPAGSSFNITCRISDPSGVYDDGTGSSGQGVYLLWDDDGSLADDANEITLSAIGGGYYSTDAQIGPRSGGDLIVYAVHACDDDVDGGDAGDRSCASSGAHTVQFMGPVYIIDEPGSLFPTAVYSGEEDVSIHIDLNNPMSQAIVLHAASTVSFSDGTHDVTATLRNETIVPGGATHFPIAFIPIQVPQDFNAPDTVDLRFDLAGTYGFLPFNQLWTASESNRLIVLKPRLLFTARPAASGDVYPGDASVELLRVEVTNDSPGDVSIDSLVVSNATAGGGGVPMNDADFGMLRLYSQADEFVSAIDPAVKESEGPPGSRDAAGRALAASDPLLAGVRFETGEARFLLPSGTWIPAGMSRYYYVVADVDSFLASDGDSLDVEIGSVDSVFITGAAPVEFLRTPLNSDGACAIDGFKAFQLIVEETIPDTLYLGDTDQLVLSFVVPANGHMPDVLSAVSTKNFGDGEVDSLVERLALWKDDGDGSFSPLADLHVGDFAATGDRFELSGLSLALSAPQRFFIAADFAFGAAAALESRFGIPEGGIENASRNDGPIDRDVSPGAGQVLLRREIVSIDALPVPSGARYPGDEGVELLALRVDNNTLGGVTVDSLRVRGISTLFTCEPGKPFLLYADDGDSGFESGADTVVAEAAWSGGAAFFTGTRLAIAPGSQRIFFVATDLDSFLTADGETLLVGLESPGDIGLTLGPSIRDDLFGLDADFPIVSAGGGVTDGILAHQVTLYPHGDSVIVEQKENILVLDILMPGNACLHDTLESLTVTNLGTAGEQHIKRLLLWRDNGDGVFDPAADDSIAEFIGIAARTYAAQALSEPLAGLPGSRYFVTMDIPPSVESGGTVNFAIPLMGIAVTSGNDGPLDREIVGPGIITIPVPDRVTFFTSIVGNKRVRPGDTHVLNLALGVYNSYQQPKTLETLTLLSVGSSRPEEIVNVEAYTDSDEDGLFNPSNDSLIGVAQSSATGYVFDDLRATLRPYRSTLLFVAYEIALVGTRDSVRVDFQISDKSSIEFLETPKIDGEFPLNSAGVDVTDGMVSAQIGVLPVPETRVSPGAVGVPCLSFALPCNGISADILESVSVQNAGSALQGQDIVYVKLWKDTGSTPLAFDSQDEFVAFLVWNGQSWKTASTLAEPVSCEGLVLHVTADLALTAEDGRNVDFCLPVNGLQVSSGNDGPINERVCSTALIEISTDPLFASFEAPAAVTRDQVFEIRLDVVNAADTTLLGVVPDSFTWAGTGLCSIVSGPAPASIDLPGKSDSSFVWIFRALSAGQLVFRGRVKQDAGPEASRVEYSDTIRIDEIPANITATLLDGAPVSLNRGQEDIALIELTIGYDPVSGHGAPVAFTSIELSMTDGAGAPLSVKDVASRVRLRDEVRVLSSVATEAIAQPSVICPLSEPIVLLPGDSKTFRISVDIATDAPASDFRLAIATSGAIALVDYNNGAAVPFSGSVFPWRTNAVTLRDYAGTLLVRFSPTAPARVNTGQENVAVFDLILENGGGAAAAPISVSDVVFTAMDADGDTIDAGNLFKAFRLTGSGGNTYAYLETFAGSASIRCAVQPAISVAAQVPVTLRGVVDCLFEPVASGFSISLRDSLDMTARDANSGQPVEVQAAAGFPGFPMNTGISLFSDPLASVAVEGQGLMEERIAVGATNAAALRIILSHPGAVQESPFSCGGITVRLLDELGGPLEPIAVLDAVRVRKGIADVALVYITALHGSDISLPFASPLVTPPGEADTLDVLFDLDAAPTRSRFQMHVNAAGIDVVDATDGRSGIPLIGSFPIVSGLGTIVFPAGQVLFGATGLLPANISAGVETECMRLVFTRQDEFSGSRVFIEGFTLEVLDENDQVIDPSLVIGALRIDDESGEIASTWRIIDDRIDVAFADTVSIGDNETRAFTLAIATTANPPAKALSLRIASPEAISCRDEATGGPVSVAPAAGAFPFNSGKAAVLPRDIETAFSNYPNPFVAGSGKTTITFYMPDKGRASVRVFTITGEPVRTIVDNESFAAGLHQELSWDGKNGNGNMVLNGVYYLVLKVSAGGRDYTFKRKVALVQ